VQAAVIEAGGLSISLLQNQTDPSKVFEIETWHSAADHQRFVKGAAEAGAFKPFDSLLSKPFEVSYLSTVKRTEKDKVA
jgi:quinol monooxygenase YgiN